MARLIVTLCSLTLLFPTLVHAGEYCVDVSEKRGWQNPTFPDGKIRRVSFSGSWSVIADSFNPVGPRGYSGRDAQRLGPLFRYKFDQSYAFGEMFVLDRASRIVPIAEFAALAVNSVDPAGTYAFRINDREDTLWNNAGTIRVAFPCDEVPPQRQAKS